MPALKKISELKLTNRLFEKANYLFIDVVPTPLSEPKLIHYNSILAEKLEIHPSEFLKKSTLDLFNGNLEFENVNFKASSYAGHQFGYFVPRLGDGRAIKLFEMQNSHGEYFEWQLKGAGLTPFSRMGDGKAVFRSSVREYLASAHMHALQIPTTEALALVSGSDPVRREEIERAAIVLRVSESFLRFGHFEYLYFHGHHTELKNLIEFVIDHYFESFKGHVNRYYLFFQEVTKRTAKLMAKWQAVGFCHGVMNTDNMSILGLTIDYGPYGFLDRFDLDHICNHSDHEGRYSFGNQPPIGKWNLDKLRIALSPFLTMEQSDAILSTYETIFNVEYQTLLRKKLGFTSIQNGDDIFLKEMLNMLVVTKMDYTNFFRQLCHYRIGERLTSSIPMELSNFLDRYDERLKIENSNDNERQNALKNINPKFILRNYLAQICIENPELIPDMFKVLSAPFDEWPEFESYSAPAPEKYQFLCVSCSS